jgi:hypothetical protein
MLSPADASQLAHAYAQRERLERAHRTLENLQTPVLILTGAAFIFFIAQNYSYWSLLVPAVIFAAHQFMYQDATNDLHRPFDINALQDDASTRMFHRIPVNEYQAAMRVARQSNTKAAEAHQMMWRAYELSALYLRTQEDVQKLAATTHSTESEARTINSKLAALQALAKDAHQALHALLNPKRHVLPAGRDGLLELVHRVDVALQEGLDSLTPRVEEINEKVAAAQRDREAASALYGPDSGLQDGSDSGSSVTSTEA